MRYISLFFIAILFFAISCGSNNTVKPKWEGCITDKNCEDGQKCIAGNCTESNTCKNDASCLNGQFCNDDKLCESYCESNDDCGVGFICNSESKKCEKDPNTHLCEQDSDCKESEICDNYKCTPKNDPKTCSSDAECLNGQHCSSNGTCTANCTADSCEDGYECNSETKECQKTVCEKDSDCKEGFYCENQECKTKEYECNETSDCFNGYECKDNKCQLIGNDTCNTVDDCDGSLTIKCAGAHWECIENTCEQKCGATTCETAEDCPGTPNINCIDAHWICKDNACVAECGGEKCGNGTCDIELGENYNNCPADCRDDHCDDGTEPMCDMMPPNCSEGQILAYRNNCYACVNPNTCKPMPETCRTNHDCGEGFICTEEGVCKAIVPECTKAIDCADHQWNVRCVGHWSCENNTCVEQCDFERCGDGECSAELGETTQSCPADCSEGPSCGDGVCQEGELYTCPEDCQQVNCRSDADCNDGNLCTHDACDNGICVNMATRCPQGMQCNPINGQCEGDTPSCGDGICQEGEEYTCPEDCQPLYCLNDDDCPAGQACVQNVCQTVTPNCPTDQFEENDDIAHPAILQNGNYDNLTITYEDEDWYSFRYDGQTTLEIKFSFINSDGDIDVYAFQNGSLITSSEGYTDSESLIIDPMNFREGEVLVNVALIQNPNEPYHECQTYSLSTSINTNTCIPDQFEDNNTRRNATNLQLGNNGANYDLTLCDSDTDWFTMQLNTYTQLRVQTDLTFKTELYLRGQFDAVATSRTSSDGHEVLTYTNNDPNARSINVMLKVFKGEITIDNNTSYDYNLDIKTYEIDY